MDTLQHYRLVGDPDRSRRFFFSSSVADTPTDLAANPASSAMVTLSTEEDGEFVGVGGGSAHRGASVGEGAAVSVDAGVS